VEVKIMRSGKATIQGEDKSQSCEEGRKIEYKE